MSATRTFAFLCVVLGTCTVSSESDDGLDDDGLDEDDTIGLIRLRTRWSYRKQDRKQVNANADAAVSSTNREVFRQVVPLNSNTFLGNVIESRYANHWVVLFCVPWFAQCTKVAKEFDELAARVHALQNGLLTMLSNEVRFAEVDCSTNKPLCNAMDVKTYPVAVHYHGGRQSQWSSGMRVNNSTMLLSKWVALQLADSSNSSCTAPKAIGALQVVELVAKAALGGLALVCLLVFCFTGMTGFSKRTKFHGDASKGLHCDFAPSYLASAPYPLSTTKEPSSPVIARPVAAVIDLDALVPVPLDSDLAFAPTGHE